MRPMATPVLALIACGVWCGLAGCGTTVRVEADTWGNEFDVHFHNQDQTPDPDSAGDTGTKDGPGDSAPADSLDLLNDTAKVDLLPDLNEVAEPDGPKDVGDDETGVPDVEPPDVEEDDQEEVPEVIVTPCGICPIEKPVCKLGKCACDAEAGSCKEGSFCHASGECMACDMDTHCGPDCVKCADLGTAYFCAEDASGCVECDATFGCPTGEKCVQGACVACSTLGLCGLYCQLCEGETPDCVGGKCSCNSSSCGFSETCEYGSCVACTTNDPAHCGSSCAVCSGANPHCKNGTCSLCNTNATCGPTCAACPSATPICRPDGAGCVQCLYNTDCASGLYCTPIATCGECLNDTQCLPSEYCGGYQCLPDKPATACPGDLAPAGTTCALAKIVSRAAAAGTTSEFSGSTTSSGANNDDASCSDGGNERFYRIYLEPLDQVELTLHPSSYYDAVLKVYVGSDCDDNGTSDLVVCKDSLAGGSSESYSFQAVTAGWYTFVVDGVSSVDDDDYGSFTLDVSLTCTLATCSCP